MAVVISKKKSQNLEQTLQQHKEPNHIGSRIILVWNPTNSGTYVSKGQILLLCPYEKLVYPKIATKSFLDFCPEIFCSFLRASWKLFGLPWDLVSNFINKEGYRKPKKLPGSPQRATKNFRVEIQKYFRWYFGWNWFFIRTFWN